MATKNFRSTVLEPTSEFAHGDKLRFTALATVGEVLKGSFSETTIGEDGVYSVDLQYGKHRIDYKPYEGVWRHFADVEVNADTLATTLQDLALASVPVTDEAVLVLQGILADAEAAKTAAETAETAAETALASIDATVDDAKNGFPDLIIAQMYTTIYVNPITGDDANSGIGASLAKRTIKSAIDSIPSGAYANIELSAGSINEITEDIVVMNKFIRIYSEDIANRSSLIQKQTANYGSVGSASYKCAQFNVSYGTISLFGLNIETAILTTPADKIEIYRIPFFAGNEPNLRFLSSNIKINNAQLCHTHNSGSYNVINSLKIIGSNVEVNNSLAISDSYQKLITAYVSVKTIMTLSFYNSSITTGQTISDLVSMSKEGIISDVNFV